MVESIGIAYRVETIQLTLNVAGLRTCEPQVRIPSLNAQGPLRDSRVTPSV